MALIICPFFSFCLRQAKSVLFSSDFGSVEPLSVKEDIFGGLASSQCWPPIIKLIYCGSNERALIYQQIEYRVAFSMNQHRDSSLAASIFDCYGGAEGGQEGDGRGEREEGEGGEGTEG